MKNYSAILAAVLTIGLVSCVTRAPQSVSRAASDIQKLDSTLDKMKSDFKDPEDLQNIEWVSKKIQHMWDIDQYARNFSRTITEQNYSAAERAEFDQLFLPRMAKIDEENTEELKRLIEVHSWFVISQFGKKTDQYAWLLVQHADQDPEFQKSILKILEKLYPKGETNPQNYAYLFDRVAASWSDPSKRELQRYGTQGQCKSKGKWEAISTEDPKYLDKRRKEVGLPPMSEYMELVKTLCR